MPDAERWPELKALFREAADLDDAARQLFLDQRCPDPTMRREIEALLDADADEDSSFNLSLPIVAGNGDDDDALLDGAIVGRYRIEREVGRGGMGAVYLATRADDAYRKQVAIKVVKRGMDTADIVQRFRHERQTLASLEHPNIAHLIDGGTTDQGLPYFVMEYVAGRPLDRYCDDHHLSIEQRLDLFLHVCGAVQHAHQNLVIHRDLKPGNMLVTEDGEPKLVDFGIAKVLRPGNEGELSEVTRHDQRPMTPRYASPEQVRGERITTASNVYALGVVLYQLLSGSLPYAGSDTSQAAIERAICDDVPQRPSQMTRNRRLKGDLDAIVMMALRKEPERRYQSVDHLADDIRRYLTGQPVLARPDTLGYRAAKFIRRNRIATAASAAAAVILIVGIVATTWAARLARQQADKAQAETARVQRMNEFLTNVLALPDSSWYSPGVGGRSDMTVIDLLIQTGKRIDQEMSAHPDLAGDLHHTIGNTFRARGRFEDAHRHFTAALALRRRVFGERHPKVAESLYFLGAAESSLGRLSRARELHEQSIAIYRQVPFAEAGNLPYELNDVGGLLVGQGEFDRAEGMYKEAAALLERRHGADDFRVTFPHQGLGNLLLQRGDGVGARRVFERVLTVLRKSPEGSPLLANALWDLGQAELMDGQHADAERLFRQAIEMQSAAKGQNDRLVGGWLLGLSGALTLQGRYAEAERAARQALTIVRAQPTPPDQTTAVALATVGWAVTGTGRLREAEGLLREAASLADRGRDQNPCVAGQMKVTLGVWLLKRGRPREAEPLFQLALDQATAGCGPQSYHVREAQKGLAAVETSLSGRGAAAPLVSKTASSPAADSSAR